MHELDEGRHDMDMRRIQTNQPTSSNHKKDLLGLLINEKQEAHLVIAHRFTEIMIRIEILFS